MPRSGFPALRVQSLGCILFICALLSTAFGQSSAAGKQKSYKIAVPATKQWVDTNIDLRGGAKVKFTATGQITYPSDQSSYESKTRTAGSFGPDGLGR